MKCHANCINSIRSKRGVAYLPHATGFLSQHRTVALWQTKARGSVANEVREGDIETRRGSITTFTEAWFLQRDKRVEISEWSTQLCQAFKSNQIVRTFPLCETGEGHTSMGRNLKCTFRVLYIICVYMSVCGEGGGVKIDLCFWSRREFWVPRK